jgi:hypothetical protein
VFNPTCAGAELESLLGAQRDDGFIVHTIFVHTPSGATSMTEPHREGDLRVDRRTANPYEFMWRERRRACG